LSGIGIWLKVGFNIVTDIIVFVEAGIFLRTVTVSFASVSHQHTQHFPVIWPVADVVRAWQLSSSALPDCGHIPDFLHHCEHVNASH
jgi:hypothetical protein